jgi:hypothetical protein
MTIKFTNNATTTLASGINSSVTSLTVASGTGTLFPTLSGSDVFYATLANLAGTVEIVQVTARSTDTFTIVRGQDGTTAATWSTGDKVELRPTAAGLAAMAQTANNLSDVASVTTARTNLGAAALASAQTFTAAQRGTVSALTDGATITPDFAVANNYSVTLGGNRTLANPTNITAGQSGIITITQDGTGSRTLAYGSYWKFAGGTAPTLTTTASAVDVLAYYVESTTRITARIIGDSK